MVALHYARLMEHAARRSSLRELTSWDGPGDAAGETHLSDIDTDGKIRRCELARKLLQAAIAFA
jgi:hypothetical protein